MAAKRTAGEGDVLPPEIVTEILLRLPVKLIVLCRSVCKSWYALISSPSFISYHLVKTPKEIGLLLQFYNRKHDNCGLSSLHRPFGSIEHHDDVSERFLGSRVGIVGSCNGLICLSKCDPPWNHRFDAGVTKATFLIWNPSIRKAVVLPFRMRKVTYRSRRFFSYIVFGFDSKTGDYKVMCTHCAYGERKSCEFSGTEENVCEIFDLRKGVWRTIRHPGVQRWRVARSHPDCDLHGAVHWTGYIRRYDKTCDRILLAFDFNDEVFREMIMPDRFGDRYIETRSVAFGGLIHMIVWKSSYHFDGCSIWVMKEYGVTESWCQLFNIDMHIAQLYGHVYPKMFRFYENGEILMVHDLQGDEDEYVNNSNFPYPQGLILYNPESRTCKRIFSLAKWISDLCLYKESLVLL